MSIGFPTRVTGKKSSCELFEKVRVNAAFFFGFWVGFYQKGKSATNRSNLGEILPNLTPGFLFMLGRSAASRITYVRPVGGPENTSNIGENPDINNLM